MVDGGVHVKILFMIDDDKTRNLCAAGKNINLDIKCPASKSVFFPLGIIFDWVKSGRKADAIVFRYLNDSPIFLLSMILFISRYFTIVLALCLRVKIIWFCHNIDKETNENYPMLTRLLRASLARHSNKIFVMDKLLVESARNEIVGGREKIDYISFGQRDNAYTEKNQGDDFIVAELSRVKKELPEGVLLGFCPTSPGDKYLHIRYAAQLVNTAKEKGIKLVVLLLGDLDKYLSENPDVKTSIDNASGVIYINKFVSYTPSVVDRFVDFYWRGLSDQSISYSLYEAASRRKPTLALNSGFLGRAVREYKLGAVVDLDMANLKSAVEEVVNWNPEYGVRFLNAHTWSDAAQRLKNAIVAGCEL